MARPLALITLLTDFGDSDWFVAAMKGVILSINPQATIIDLSHRIPAHAVEDGAYVWKSCYRYFPPGTVHIAVVDPGVGTKRRPLIAHSARYFFFAPDNGLLTWVAGEEDDLEVRSIENKHYRLESEGNTFDGRDVFAPAAAWLTKNQPVASFGPIVESYRTFPRAVPRWVSGKLVGEVMYVDHFGNVISNVTAAHLAEVRDAKKRPDANIRVGDQVIDGLVESYSEGDPQQLRALINSNGNLECFLKEGSAAARFAIGRHTVVVLE
ncbi:MAG TPA: SAM-dependent chlorinase/fluorinase [Nitrospira sp.]|nr:SAM-dependent chlorinase/fluorinase [Nitrospira sp.]